MPHWRQNWASSGSGVWQAGHARAGAVMEQASLVAGVESGTAAPDGATGPDAGFKIWRIASGGSRCRCVDQARGRLDRTQVKVVQQLTADRARAARGVRWVPSVLAGPSAPSGPSASSARRASHRAARLRRTRCPCVLSAGAPLADGSPHPPLSRRPEAEASVTAMLPDHPCRRSADARRMTSETPRRAWHLLS